MVRGCPNTSRIVSEITCTESADARWYRRFLLLCLETVRYFRFNDPNVIDGIILCNRFFHISSLKRVFRLMKIWQVDPANLTPYYNIALCKALAELGHDIRYVTSNYLYDQKLVYPDMFQTDIHYFRMLEDQRFLRVPRLRKLFRAVVYPMDHFRLFKKMQREKPDIVHLQWSRLPAFDRRLIAKIRRLGIPVVHTIHDVEPLFLQGRFTGNLKDIYANVDALILHTEENRSRFLQSFAALDPARIFVIPHIALRDYYAPSVVSQKDARDLVGIQHNVPVVLFFGAVKHYKGLDVLAEAIPRVHAEYPEVQFWIIGHPETQQDSDLLSVLSAVTNTHVRAEYIPSDIVWQYFTAADLVVFPYRDISQSGALYTALGFGRPVIVTNVGGFPEVVSGNGWVIPREDPEALAKTLIEAFSNPELIVQMGTRSIRILDEFHAPHVVARQFIELYQSLLA